MLSNCTIKYKNINYAQPAFASIRHLNLLDCTIQNRSEVLSQTTTLKNVNTAV